MKLINTTAKISDLIIAIGSAFLSFVQSLGEKILFMIVAIFSVFRPPVYFKNMWKQFVEIAFYSLPIVGLTAFFTGMVLALQSYVGFARFSAEGAIANVVVISITRELGPVLTALMVAGRISGAMAAEIGTMKVSEQLDALYTMSVNPIKYLITPKIIAGILALPILVMFANIIGVMGGWITAVVQLDFSSSLYLKNTISFVQPLDVISGLVKAAVFGLIITVMGCYFGYFSGKGSLGVGKATTNAVVVSSILIFFFDYILTVLFFNV
ncbi:MAG: ABC transporter permease [Alphaproteobacteria bacterium]|jgi:phospholipid/cholesterol/gamma-HCH transport system permease protein|nr:ABC transporter permease [Alphaproteobacteria bacterium]